MGRENKTFRGALLFLLIAVCVVPTAYLRQCFAETDEAVNARIQKLITRIKDGSPRARRMAAQGLRSGR